MLFRNAGTIHLLLPSLKLTAKTPKVGRLQYLFFFAWPIFLRGNVVSLRECTPGIFNIEGYIKGQTPLNHAMNHLPIYLTRCPKSLNSLNIWTSTNTYQKKRSKEESPNTRNCQSRIFLKKMIEKTV